MYLLPFYILHDEVRQTVFRCASVKKTRDVGMIQRGQNLSFVAEAAHYEIRVHAALYQLDCDALLKLVVGAHGQKDRTHAAAPNLAHSLVRSNATTNEFVNGFFDYRLRRERAAIGVAPCAFIRGYERLDLIAQPLIRAARVREKSLTLAGRKPERRLEHFFNFLPTLRIHKTLTCETINTISSKKLFPGFHSPIYEEATAHPRCSCITEAPWTKGQAYQP